jgi:hypothetical protein
MPVSINYVEDSRAQEIAQTPAAYAEKSLEEAQERASQVVSERSSASD